MNESNQDHRNPAAPIRVLVADDHTITRHGLSMLCRNADGIELVAEAADGNEAIKLVKECRPNVVLMDIDMPHCNGIEATRLIHQDYPAVGVIILTAHKEAETTLEALKEAETTLEALKEAETTFEALKAGAMGCLPKSARLDEIRSAVKAVADGGAVFDAVQAVNLMDQFNSWGTKTRCRPEAYAHLTVSEFTILADLSDGMTVAQIANKRRISPRTVSTHLGNIYRKLHVNNWVDAVKYAPWATTARPLTRSVTAPAGSAASQSTAPALAENRKDQGVDVGRRWRASGRKVGPRRPTGPSSPPELLTAHAPPATAPRRSAALPGARRRG
jgi:DNA-binding NarL/FixJ family response regulator